MPTGSIWKAQEDKAGHFAASGTHALISVLQEKETALKKITLEEPEFELILGLMSVKVLYFNLYCLNSCESVWIGRNYLKKEKKFYNSY